MAKKKKPAAKSKKNELTCFVVIGFGKKTDYYTGRTLNLDATYHKLIKPAFDRVGVRCFRAIDVNRTGSIDKLMYYWIYHADFVVADLSTMNANVFYELGVRHAQKKASTLLMVEDGVFEKNRLPFDLSHMIIRSYQHLGNDIAKDMAEKFVDDFAKLLEDLIENPVEESKESTTDSPVYTYMEGMQPPKYVDLQKEFERHQKNDAKKAESDPEDVKLQSLARIIERAEEAKREEDYPTAIALFNTAIDDDPKALFLRQRLALVTYKQVEDYDRGNAEQNEEAIQILRSAEEILLEHCKLRSSTDPETLGLAGAINKRLYARTDDQTHFDRSVFYYEKGFYIGGDYYNGINVAYMYSVKAAALAKAGDEFNAIVNYGHANMIRRKVAEICEELTRDEASFADRGDRVWVWQTLAQAYLGLDQNDKVEETLPEIDKLSEGPFDKTTFQAQNEGLIAAMNEFKRRFPNAGAPSAAAPSTPVTDALTTPAPAASTPPDVDRPSGGPISIDLGSHQDKPVKSIEINCKVEFE